MKTALTTLVLVATIVGLAGCQTSLLKPMSGNSAFATVKYPILWGPTQITVMFDSKSYTGVAGELHDKTTDEMTRRFGWESSHEHPNIKQEVKFFYGSTTLTANNGEKLACDHLKHGDDWRLRCKTADGKEIALYRIKQ